MAVKPSLIVHPHALVGDGRIVEVATFLHNETLGAYIERLGVSVPAGPVSVWHNGYRVPDALWKRLIPHTGDQIVIRQRATGGDGGKVLRSVAMLALVVAAAWVVGPSALALTGWQAAAVQAGIMIGGSLLITTLLPPPKPTAANLGATTKYESNPTYAISGGRNQARLWQPMMLIFGRHKVVPDLAANYYTEYVGDTQFLNQIFHFGLQLNAVSLTDYKIGDTPVSNYQGVQLQGSDPASGGLSMFPGNVDTMQGFALASGVVNSRTTSAGVTHISVELAAQLFYVNDTGGMDARSVDLRLQYRPVGGSWVDIGLLKDAVYATHYWAKMQIVDSIIGVDAGIVYTYEQQMGYGSTNYADHTDGETFVISPGYSYGGGDAGETTVPAVMGVWRWKPHPYQLGQPWAGRAPDPLIGYSSSPGIRLTGARQEVTRQTIAWDVAPGQYEVQAWKVTGDISSSRESNQTAVNQILCYQPDSADYSGQQRIAMRIQATAQLNGAVDEFNAIAAAWCPVWNGSAWVWAQTSNPAWWFLWYARGKFDASNNRVYGAGLADTQIDIAGIKAWGAWCDANRLTFNYVLTEAKSVHDVLVMIARAGRASYTWQTGKIGVIWDAANLPIVAMIGPYNIKAGTFEVNYSSDQTADNVVLNFVNPARNWQPDVVRVKVPNVTATNNTVTLDLDGCTNADMAGREANLIAASQAFHRRKVTWEMDIEGMVATRGDVVQFSHDLTVWSYSGRCLGLTGTTITLDKTVPAAATGWATLRAPDNTLATVQVTAVPGDVDKLTIASALPAGFPLPGDPGYEDVVTLDWAWQFDPLQTPGRRIKIIDAQPSGTDGVRFTGQDDDPGYYASESNPYAYTPPRDGALLSGVVFSIGFAESIVNVAADITNVQINWALSSNMPAQVVVTINGQPQPAVVTTNRTLTVQAKTGDVVSVTVTPKPSAGASGTPLSQSHTVDGLAAPLPAVTGLTNAFRDGLTVLAWNRVTDVRQPDYEVRLGGSWASASLQAAVPDATTYATGDGLYWVAARFVYRNEVIYGEPDSLQISGASLVRNVLVEVDEAPSWAGDKAGAVVINNELTMVSVGDILAVDDILAVPDVVFYGEVLAGSAISQIVDRGDILATPDILAIADVLTYDSTFAGAIYETPPSNRVDIGFEAAVKLDFDIDYYALNLDEDIFAIADILTSADVLNGSNLLQIRVRPQVRYTSIEDEWGPWVDYVPGLLRGRYFDVRLILETRNPRIVPFVRHFSWTVDVPDLVQSGTEITIPAGGARISYPKPFHAQPNIQIATYDATDGDRYVLSNSDFSGFNISMQNGSTNVSRTVNWLSQGY